MDSHLARDSRYELLRIVAAIMITLNHIPCSSEAPYHNLLIKSASVCLGQVGVTLYVLIGSWFLANRNFRADRITNMLYEVSFYIILLDILCMFIGRSVGFDDIVKSTSYWFCFGYFILLILYPLLQSLEIRTRVSLVILDSVIACVVTVIGQINTETLLVKLFSKGLFIGPFWFCYIFMLVSLVKERVELVNIPRMIYLIIAMIAYIMMLYVYINNEHSSIRDIYSPMCLITALSLFAYFATMKEFKNKTINKVSSATFGVYLLQSHQLFKSYWWEGAFHLTEESMTVYYPLVVAFACIATFSSAYFLTQCRLKLYSVGIIEKSKRVLTGIIQHGIDRLYSRITGISHE